MPGPEHPHVCLEAAKPHQVPTFLSKHVLVRPDSETLSSARVTLLLKENPTFIYLKRPSARQGKNQELESGSNQFVACCMCSENRTEPKSMFLYFVVIRIYIPIPNMRESHQSTTGTVVILPA